MRTYTVPSSNTPARTKAALTPIKNTPGKLNQMKTDAYTVSEEQLFQKVGKDETQRATPLKRKKVDAENIEDDSENEEYRPSQKEPRLGIGDSPPNDNKNPREIKAVEHHEEHVISDENCPNMMENKEENRELEDFNITSKLKPPNEAPQNTLTPRTPRHHEGERSKSSSFTRTHHHKPGNQSK